MKQHSLLVSCFGGFAFALWLLHLTLWSGVFWMPPSHLDLIELRTVFAVAALALLAVGTLVARPGQWHLVYRFVALFLVSAVVFETALTFLLGGWEFYTGWKLGVVVARFWVYLTLSAVTIWGFLRGRSWVPWAMCAVGLSWLISVAWIIEPNSQRYVDLRDELLAAAEEQQASEAPMSSVVSYPEFVHYVFFFGATTYAFVVRRRFAEGTEPRLGAVRVD